MKLIHDAGFTNATMHGGLSVKQQVAFLVNSLGETETLHRLLELCGEDVVANGESPASIEFQVRLTSNMKEQAERLSIPVDDVLPEVVAQAGFGPICTLAGDSPVRLHPWVTMSGEILLQWRTSRNDHLARIYEADGCGELRMTLETAESREDLTFTEEGLSAFIRFGL